MAPNRRRVMAGRPGIVSLVLPGAIALARDATLARDASKLLGSGANPISAAAARQQGTSA